MKDNQKLSTGGPAPSLVPGRAGACGLAGASRWFHARSQTTTLLAAVFAWRGTVSWLAVLGGQEEKVVAARIITAMGVASVVTLVVLLSAGGARPPPPCPAP